MARSSSVMLFQSGSRIMSNTTELQIDDFRSQICNLHSAICNCRRSLWAGGNNRGVDASKLLEVLPEHVGEFVRLCVVGRLVAPRVPGIQNFRRYVVARLRDRQPENRIDLGFGV